jgi:O-antigen ligase
LVHLSAALLVACVILGGATRPGYLSDASLQLLCIPVLLAAIARLNWPTAKRIRFPLIFLGALLAVPLLQLLPLPESVWFAVPHRQPVALLDAETIRRRISVAPHATWQSLASLLVPLTVFISVSQLDHRDRKWLSLVLLGLGILGMFLALLQLHEGPGSALRLFDVTNSDEAVGFFANRNHFGALLYCMIPLTVAWIAQPIGAIPGHPGVRGLSYDISMRMAGFVLCGALIAMQAMTRSRAGMALALAALIGSYILVRRNQRIGSRFGLALLLACIVAGTFAADVSRIQVLERFAANPLSDARPSIAEATLTAIRAYLPFGSGVGTFSIVYGEFERPENVLPAYINRAHSDVLEWVLEAGFLGICLMITFLIWLLLVTLRAGHPSTHDERERDLLPRAASLIIWMLIAHSFVDYPLRTAALMAIFAFCCAVLIAPCKPHPRHDTPSPDVSEPQMNAPRPIQVSLNDDWPEAWKNPKP